MTDRELLKAGVTDETYRTDRLIASVGDDGPLSTIHRLAGMVNLGYENEYRSRVRLIKRHGWISVLSGLAMMISGGPALAEIEFGTFLRLVLGLSAVAAGAVTLIGIRWDHSNVLERVGLCMIGGWYTIMAFLTVLTIGSYGEPMVFSWPWHLNNISLTQPRIFGVVIYAGLASMIWSVHLQAIADARRLRQML